MATLTLTDSTKDDWIITDNVLLPCGGKASITDQIKPGIWRVVPSPIPNDQRIGITYVGKSFEIGLGKIYNTGGEEISELIKKTWNSKNFRKTQRNLCTILKGTRGTGKTLTSKLLCNDFVKDLPVIILDGPFDGKAVGLIQTIDFDCVVLVDEAEKSFSNEFQVDLLKICDGVHSRSSKVILMTVNELRVDPNLISRPGRVRYIHEFKTLDEEVCREFLIDNLDNKDRIEDIFSLVNRLRFCTIDILTNIVEEFNMHEDIDQIERFLNLDILPTNISLLLARNIKNKSDLKEFISYVNSIPRNKLIDLYKQEEIQYDKEARKSINYVVKDINKYLFKKFGSSVEGFSIQSPIISEGLEIENLGTVITKPDSTGLFFIEAKKVARYEGIDLGEESCVSSISLFSIVNSESIKKRVSSITTKGNDNKENVNFVIPAILLSIRKSNGLYGNWKKNLNDSLDFIL